MPIIRLTQEAEKGPGEADRRAALYYSLHFFSVTPGSYVHPYLFQ